MIQANTRSSISTAVAAHGLAPGAASMINLEQAAAQHAIDTGMYASWRSSNGTDCTRVGPGAKCFCDHSFEEHGFVGRRGAAPRCLLCPCRAFAFIPLRCGQGPGGPQTWEYWHIEYVFIRGIHQVSSIELRNATCLYR